MLRFPKDGSGKLSEIQSGVKTYPPSAPVSTSSIAAQLLAYCEQGRSGGSCFLPCRAKCQLFSQGGRDGKWPDRWASGLAVSPDGKFLYAANRKDDSFAIFACAPADGRLTLITVLTPPEAIARADG